MKHPKSYDSTPETRKRMSNIKLKGGKAETALAKALWQRGYRYRKNDRRLPGSPDIAILKYRIAVFIDGEFWHGKDWKTQKGRLGRNREYWLGKIEENIVRDMRNDRLLTQIGWTPIHFWEKEIVKNLSACIEAIEDLILAQIVESTEAAGPLEQEE